MTPPSRTAILQRVLASPVTRVVMVVALGLAVPWTLYGAKSAWDINANRVEDWLPATYDETKTLVKFVERFGSDELILVTWDGCTLDDPRLPALARALQQPAAPPGVRPAPAPATADGEAADGTEASPAGPVYYSAVLTGPEALAQLTAEPLRLPPAVAKSKLTGWLLSGDGKTTCLVGLVSAEGAADRPAAVEWVRRCADGVDGLSRGTLRMAGPTFEGVAVDEASKAGLMSLNLWSWGVCLALLFFSLRSVRLAVAVFCVALFNEQAIMAIIYFTAGQFDSMLLLTANLGFVLSISAGLHLANYYREAVADGAAHPAARALRESFVPSLMSATTTALGVISLAVSEIVPIKRFGLYSGISVVTGAFVLLAVIGVLMAAMTTRRTRRVGVVWPLPPLPDRALTAVVHRLRWPLVVGAVALLAVGAAATSRLRTSVSLADLFQPDSDVLRDYRFIEERIGPLTPVEVVVSFPTAARDAGGRPYATVDRVRVVREIHHAVDAVPQVESVVSAWTFVQSLPAAKPTKLRAIVEANAARVRFDRSRDAFRYLRFVHDGIAPGAAGSADGAAALTLPEEDWRISARVPSTAGHDFAALTEAVQAAADAAAAKYPEQTPRVWVTGGMPVIQKAQSTLLSDLIVSFISAFALIATALMLVFRSVLAGLLAMIANVLPPAVVFGYMAIREIPIEIGAVLTASAAMGIAVDDTVHFITWFQRGTREGLTAREAVASAYRRSGAAMIQSTLVVGLGLLVFAVSPFVPIARFGYLMAALLGLGVAGNTFIMPAILVSPLGRFFIPAKRSPRPAKPAVPARRPAMTPVTD